jgi:AraC-like DNA-binding protein
MDPGMPEWPPETDHAHVHEFLTVAYFESGHCRVRIDAEEMEAREGTVLVVAPGEVIGTPVAPYRLEEATAWSAYFLPDALGAEATRALLSWRSHPLLFPFVRGTDAGVQRLEVPAGERAWWGQRFALLDRELRERRDGYGEAAISLLTLLLVDVGRLAASSATDTRFHTDPLLASVFSVIEDRFAEGISLSDIAQVVSLTPGYLTTLVRQRTGRPVQEWITERRMAAARRLLADTARSIDEIAAAVGYNDGGYFVRTFRRYHGVTPAAWRRAGVR